MPAVDAQGQRAMVKAANKKPESVAKSKATAKVKAKAKAIAKKKFLKRTHKRGEAVAHTVHDNMENKQVVQLVTTYVPDAAAKVQTWVDALNSGSLTVEQVMQAKDDIMTELSA